MSRIWNHDKRNKLAYYATNENDIAFDWADEQDFEKFGFVDYEVQKVESFAQVPILSVSVRSTLDDNEDLFVHQESELSDSSICPPDCSYDDSPDSRSWGHIVPHDYRAC